MNIIVHTPEKWQFEYICNLFNDKWIKPTKVSSWNAHKESTCINLEDGYFASSHYYKVGRDTIKTFEEFKIEYKLNINKITEKSMVELIKNVLEGTYNNPILRRKTVPLLMSNPGLGKTTLISEFAESKGVKMKKITLSQRMPNEVVGMVMPSINSNRLEVFDSHELSELKDGDILFLDEVFNGTLKQTLDATLNLLEDRVLPTGKKLADVLIVAASNHQGLINLTPQIKERFIKYDLKFSAEDFELYLRNKYGMPGSISKNLTLLVQKEKFESNAWDYVTPRSIEKAINQIGCEIPSPYDERLLPHLSKTIEAPIDIQLLGIKQGEEVEYLKLLKLFIKKNNLKANESTKNHKQESRVTSSLPG